MADTKLIGAQADPQLIELIDQAAKHLGLNRSTFIRQALETHARQTLNQPTS